MHNLSVLYKEMEALNKYCVKETPKGVIPANQGQTCFSLDLS